MKLQRYIIYYFLKPLNMEDLLLISFLTFALSLQRSFTWALFSLKLPYEEIQQNLVYGFVKMFGEREVWSGPF